MTDFLEQWANQNEANAKLFAQEVLITQATEEIWKAMEEAGISKADLARKMDATKGHISQILNGSRNMTLRTLADICFALDYQPTLRLEPKKTTGGVEGQRPGSLIPQIFKDSVPPNRQCDFADDPLLADGKSGLMPWTKRLSRGLRLPSIFRGSFFTTPPLP